MAGKRGRYLSDQEGPRGREAIAAQQAANAKEKPDPAAVAKIEAARATQAAKDTASGSGWSVGGRTNYAEDGWSSDR